MEKAAGIEKQYSKIAFVSSGELDTHNMNQKSELDLPKTYAESHQELPNKNINSNTSSVAKISGLNDG